MFLVSGLAALIRARLRSEASVVNDYSSNDSSVQLLSVISRH